MIVTPQYGQVWAPTTEFQTVDEFEIWLSDFLQQKEIDKNNLVQTMTSQAAIQKQVDK